MKQAVKDLYRAAYALKRAGLDLPAKLLESYAGRISGHLSRAQYDPPQYRGASLASAERELEYALSAMRDIQRDYRFTF